MKIVLESGSGTASDPLKRYFLADDFARGITRDDVQTLAESPIQEKSTSGEQLFELVPMLRSEHPKLFDRLNEHFGMAFSVARKHASFNAAELFVLDHISELPRRGLVIVTANAQAPRSRFFPNAIIQRPRLLSHIGISTIWSYSFTAPTIATTRQQADDLTE